MLCDTYIEWEKRVQRGLSPGHWEILHRSFCHHYCSLHKIENWGLNDKIQDLAKYVWLFLIDTNFVETTNVVYNLQFIPGKFQGKIPSPIQSKVKVKSKYSTIPKPTHKIKIMNYQTKSKVEFLSTSQDVLTKGKLSSQSPSPKS